MTKKKFVRIDITEGGGSKQLYINDYRVAGGKPWGGGRILSTFKVEKSEFLKDIETALSCDDGEDEE